MLLRRFHQGIGPSIDATLQCGHRVRRRDGQGLFMLKVRKTALCLSQSCGTNPTHPYSHRAHHSCQLVAKPVRIVAGRTVCCRTGVIGKHLNSPLSLARVSVRCASAFGPGLLATLMYLHTPDKDIVPAPSPFQVLCMPVSVLAFTTAMQRASDCTCFRKHFFGSRISAMRRCLEESRAAMKHAKTTTLTRIPAQLIKW